MPHTLLLAWLLAPTWGLSLNAPFRMVPSRVAARTLGHWRLHEHIHADCAETERGRGLERFSQWMWETGEDADRVLVVCDNDGAFDALIGGYIKRDTMIVCAMAESPITDPDGMKVLATLLSHASVRMIGVL